MRAKQTTFLTRTRGTRNQIGKVFPTTIRAKRPHIFTRALARRSKTPFPLTPVEKHAIEKEKRLLASGFKGFTITIKLKNGRIEDIPLIAKDWEAAFKIAQKNMRKYDPALIDEIVIVDPSLGEILHKMGAGAKRAAGAIARGAKWVGRKAAGVAKAAKRKAAAEFERMREEQRAIEAERRAAAPAPIGMREEDIPMPARPVRPLFTEEEWREAPPPEVYRPMPAVEEMPAPVAALAPTIIEEAPRVIREAPVPPGHRRVKKTHPTLGFGVSGMKTEEEVRELTLVDERRVRRNGMRKHQTESLGKSWPGRALRE
jgi:hypothetical protein